jgi:hypothetical protein
MKIAKYLRKLKEKPRTFLVLIAVLAIVVNTALSAPPAEVKDVNVINTPNVNVTNTPTVKLADGSNVNVAGTVDVNITNKATVNVESGSITVGNQETNPVPVKITEGNINIQPSIPTFYKYSIKFACGATDYPFSHKIRISINNPQSSPITISRMIIKSLPIDQTPVPPIQLASYDIQPDYALEITCDTMQNMGEIGGNPVTGFMIINSSKPLNVVGTYFTGDAAGPGGLYPISSDVEIISPIPIY